MDFLLYGACVVVGFIVGFCAFAYIINFIFGSDD